MKQICFLLESESRPRKPLAITSPVDACVRSVVMVLMILRTHDGLAVSTEYLAEELNTTSLAMLEILEALEEMKCARRIDTVDFSAKPLTGWVIHGTFKRETLPYRIRNPQQ